MSDLRYTRRQKYGVARAAGFSRTEAQRMRGWSHQRLRNAILHRAMETQPTGKDKRRVNYYLARSAGQSRAEAQRTRQQSTSRVIRTTTLRVVAPPTAPISDAREYEPMPRAYRLRYAHVVRFTMLSEDEDVVQHKNITVLSLQPRSAEEIMDQAYEALDTDLYGVEIVGVEIVKRYQAGLPGGVR